MSLSDQLTQLSADMGYFNSFIHAGNTDVDLGDGTTIPSLAKLVANLTANIGGAINIAAGTGYVGIGTAAPGSPLTVAGTYNNPAAASSLQSNSANLSYTADNANQFNFLTINGSNVNVSAGKTMSGGLSCLRIDAFLNNAASAGTITTQQAVWARAGILLSSSSAVVSTAVAVTGEIRNDIAGATVSTLSGFRVNAGTIAGIVTNLYGFYMPAITVTGTVTNRYGIYIADAAAYNYFGGFLGIGASNSNFPLYVIGGSIQAVLADSQADSATKSMRLGTNHYLSAEEKVCAIYLSATSTTNILAIGGGTSAMNAATLINFLTGANNTTTTGTVAMSIDNGQNVAISAGGTGIGNAKLYVTGHPSGMPVVRIDSDNNATQALDLRSLGTASMTMVTYRYGSTQVGSVSITSSATAFNTTSDQRIKEVIAGAYDFSAVIDAVTPHRYHRTDITDETIEAFGFFAQELHEAVPDAVTVGSEEDPGEEGFIPWQVDNSKLVPYLWAEVQSLRSRVAALEPH